MNSSIEIYLQMLGQLGNLPYSLPIVFALLISIGISALLYRKYLLLRNSKTGAEHTLQALFDNSFSAILIIEPQSGMILNANTLATSFYGYSKNELTSMPIWGINTLGEEPIRKIFAQILLNKQRSFRFRHQLKSGDKRDVAVKTVPIIYQNRECILSNIKEANNNEIIESELVDTKMEFTSTKWTKEELLSLISHEMRTPLFPIISYTEMLHKDAKSDEEKELLKTILSSGLQLKEIIDDVLHLSKISAGKYQTKSVPTEIDTFLETLLDSFIRTYPEREFVIVNGGRPSLQTLENKLSIICAHEPIKYILTNFISNAVKYSNDGPIKLSYGQVMGENNKPLIRFEVDDQGIGIPDEFKHKIFEPFNQWNNHFSNEVHGVGLGLAISQKLAEEINGELGFKSEVLKGSTFWLDIDLMEAPKANEKTQVR